MENTNKFNMEFKVGIGMEPIALDAVIVYGKAVGFDERDCGDIKTAVSEALGNVARFAYPDGIGLVKLSMYVSAQNDLIISAKDKGVGIPDVQKARMPLYTSDPEKKQSGMGFTIMEAFADKVFVKSAPGRGTTVTMRFHSKKNKNV